VKKGYTVLAPDMVGWGEMGPGDFKGDAYIGNTSFNIWFASIQIGRSIVGIRTSDLIKLARLLNADTSIKQVYGVAREQAAPVLLHAAAFEPLIERVALAKPYSSYQSIVMNQWYNPVFIPNTVPGAIGAYDLPDLAASLYPRKLLIMDVTDGLGETGNQQAIEKDMEVIKTTYRNNNAQENLMVMPTRSGREPRDFFTECLK